jgi:hypothetical protein
MAIKRYTANADTTITNAFQADLTTRGTGSNMGLSDSLEIFSIYGQTISGSNATKTAELSRILVNFSVADMVTDRANGDLPASGSVSFYLRMFNAEHPFTVPRSYTLSASAVTADWEEGNGLDMEGYRDLTYDNTGSNWINANSNNTLATATITVSATDVANIGEGDTIKLITTDRTTVTLTMQGQAGSTTSAETSGTTLTAKTLAAGSYASSALHATAQADEIMRAINYHTKFSATKSSNVITVTQITGGGRGNTEITITEIGATGLSKTDFTGGDGSWARPGGDYDRYPTSSFEQSFDHGTEDLEINISTLVEQWFNSSGNVLGDKSSARYGIGIHLTSSQEARYIDTSITDGDYGLLKNPTGSTNSYYTKKFFARGSEYFFKRPIIEARWDSSKKDNRGNFYLSSSLVPAADNLNTLYLYNYVRGQLKDIPKLGGPGAWVDGTTGGTLDNVTKTKLNVRIYTSLTGSNAKTLPLGGGVTVNNGFVITASYVASGTYSASFAYTGSATTIYDVWSTGSSATIKGTGASYKEFHTGSGISVKTFNSYDYNPNETYVTSVPNLKSAYSNKETARFRLFTRKKDWNPTIYTKATAEAETEIVEDVYYKVFRIYDDLTVVDYGTGSLNQTRTSYDISGSYFDLNMSMFQVDYMYGIKVIYYLNGKYVEQPEVFKFRVEKDLTDIE